MTDVRPKLKAVGGEPRDAAADPAPAAAPSAEPRVHRVRRTSWLIAALLVLACLALVIQTRRVGALSGEVTRLSSDLAGARAALVAYEGRLASVRELVSDLSRRVGQLDTLVSRDPLAPLDEEPPAAPAAPAAEVPPEPLPEP